MNLATPLFAAMDLDFTAWQCRLNVSCWAVPSDTNSKLCVSSDRSAVGTSVNLVLLYCAYLCQHNNILIDWLPFKSERPTLAKLVTYYMRSGKLSLRGDLSDTLIAFVTYTLTYLLWEETTSFRKSVDAHTHTHTQYTDRLGKRDGETADTCTRQWCCHGRSSWQRGRCQCEMPSCAGCRCV